MGQLSATATSFCYSSFFAKSGDGKRNKERDPEMFQSPLIACHLSHKASIPHHQTTILCQNNPINSVDYSDVIKKSQKLGIFNNKGTWPRD